MQEKSIISIDDMVSISNSAYIMSRNVNEQSTTFGVKEVFNAFDSSCYRNFFCTSILTVFNHSVRTIVP